MRTACWILLLFTTPVFASNTLCSRPYVDLVHPTYATELGKLATELQALDVRLAMPPEAGHPFHPEGGYDAKTKTLYLSVAAATAGKVDAATHDHLLRMVEGNADERYLASYGLGFVPRAEKDDPHGVRLRPDATTEMGQFVRDMEAIGVKVYVDTHQMHREGAAGRHSDGVLVLSRGALRDGRPGVAAIHEADHAFVGYLRRQGIDCLFHGQVTPYLAGGKFNDVPAIYAPGFRLDEPRGVFKAALHGSASLVAEIRYAQENSGKPNRVAELTRASLEQFREALSLTRKVEALAGSVSGDLARIQSPPPVVPRSRWSFFRAEPAPPSPTISDLFASVPASERGKPQPVADVRVGVDFKARIDFPHLNSTVAAPEEPLRVFGSGDPAPSVFTGVTQSRFEKLARVHRAMRNEQEKIIALLEAGERRGFNNQQLGELAAALSGGIRSLPPLTERP